MRTLAKTVEVLLIAALLCGIAYATIKPIATTVGDSIANSAAMIGNASAIH